VTFTFVASPPELASTVKTIWVARGTKAEFGAPDPIVPDGCVELIFNLGDPFTNAATGERQPRDLLAGQITCPVVAEPTGAVDLVGVRFRSSRAGAALRTPMWELRDRLVAASSVLSRVDHIADALRETPAALRLDLLTRALANAFAPVDDRRLSAVDQALAVIESRRGNIGVDLVARRAGISCRHLERRFQDEVGLGVKDLARIVRLHGALACLEGEPTVSGADIAARCGYSDQAHLVRECRAFTGRTPSRFATDRPSLSALIRES
jgi:AraC-like DNA-binding protein